MSTITYIGYRGVWGSSSNDVYAVGVNYGSGSGILHYDGNAWSSMDSGGYQTLLGVWGSSGSDIFAVGINGSILHYDGSGWSAMSSGTLESLRGVWGSSGSDVYAVGEDGTILHYDGSTWSPMVSGTRKELHAVWGSSSRDVYAVGAVGTILHYVPPPQAVADLAGVRAGNDLQLAWSAATQDIRGNPITPDHYRVYRCVGEPYFVPNPSDIVVTPSTPSFTDPGVLDDPAAPPYYVVTAVDSAGFESAPSNRLGAFAFDMTPAAGAGERAYNLIAVNVDVPGVSDADTLAAYVGPGVYMILQHNATTQTIEWRLPGLAGTDFPIGVGDVVFLYLDDTAPGVVSLIGAVPAVGSVSFDLSRPAPGGSCMYNFISVPLHRDDLVDADALAADISGVYSVGRYNANTQDLTWRIPGVSGQNFPVRAGYPYIVCLDETAPPTWP
jgi:hypothetical protein